MRRIEDAVRRNAETRPDSLAVVCGGEEVTYARLWQRVQARAAELRAQGLREGEAVVVRASQDTDFLVTYFGIHLAGGVSVPLERTLPDERVREIEDAVKRSPLPEGTADILFTTGTTGKSKGVIISHETILANAENLVEAHAYSRQLTFIVCGALNHIGSLSKVYPVMLSGASLCIMEGMKDVNAFFEALSRSAAKYATFLVPSSIRMLLTLAGDKLGEYADVLDFIETGAAPMAQADMERLCRLLPRTRLFNTYASTETGIVCTHDFHAGPCVAGCVGRPMRHASVFLTENGTVACRGKTLMTGYVGEPALTAEILRDGCLFTRDNGVMDAEGRLHLTGRADDVINVGGFKVDPSEVEDVALSLPEVADCVCVPVPHPVMGFTLKLITVLAEGQTLDKKRMARHIRSKLEAYKVPAAYETADSIHRTYNGKIDRKKYRQGE